MSADPHQNAATQLADVAVRLARTSHARRVAVDELIGDAMTLMTLSTFARQRAETQPSDVADVPLPAGLGAIVAKYGGGELSEVRCSAGGLIGLRLRVGSALGAKTCIAFRPEDAPGGASINVR